MSGDNVTTIDYTPFKARLDEVERALADASARGAKLTGERQAAVEAFRAQQLAVQAEVDTLHAERARLLVVLELDPEKPATQHIGV